jgi:putative spermidine/putrescine transport system permease protein
MKRSGRGWLFYMLLAYTLAVASFLIVPVALSVLTGLTENQFIGLSSGLTLKWVFKVWNEYQQSIWLSLLIALACLACNLIIGIPLAYVVSRLNKRTARLIEELLMLPIALPGMATGLALIVTYGAVGNFRTHWTFILVGHVLFTLPFMVRSVLAVMLSVNMAMLEEGARSLGASFTQRFRTIVLPNCMTGIVAGALMVLTLSIGEFNMSLLLHTPLTQTLPVGLADAYASLRIEVGSAYTIIFFVMIVPLLMALQLAGGLRTKGNP